MAATDGMFMLIASAGTNEVAIAEVVNCNAKTSRFGLTLTPEQARELVAARARALADTGRIEFSSGIFRKIITVFCDSPFMSEENYVETLCDLVEAFYYYKNDMLDELSDDELILYMKAYFDKKCGGSMDLLRDRELQTLARSIRFGFGWSLEECREGRHDGEGEEG